MPTRCWRAERHQAHALEHGLLAQSLVGLRVGPWDESLASGLLQVQRVEMRTHTNEQS